jgi:hypothetical protein
VKITSGWLKRKEACKDGYDYFVRKYKTGTELTVLLEGLQKDGKQDWAWWVLKNALKKPQSVEIAVYAAESVLQIFEKKYPEDKRPRKAIETAKAWLKNPCEETRMAAWSAAWYAAESAAWSAASAWYAEWSAEWSAESAEWVAWYAAWYAAESAESAESVAWATSAAWSAARSAALSAAVATAESARSAARSAVDSAGAGLSAENKIIDFAIRLLKKGRIKK